MIFCPKKGGQQSNNDNFFTRPSGNRKADSPTTWLEDFRATKLPRRRCVLLRRPRFRSPPGRNGWMKEPKTGSFRTVSRWRMIKDTQLAWFLHGKAIPQCYPAGGQALFHFLGKVLPHGVKSWHFSIPLHIQQQLLGYDSGPWFQCVFLSNLLGLSRFQVSDSLRDGTVSQAPWQKCCHLGLKTTRDMIHHFVARELWHSGRNGIQQEQQPVVHVMLHILGQGGCKAL